MYDARGADDLICGVALEVQSLDCPTNLERERPCLDSSVVSLTLLYISRILKKVLRVTLNPSHPVILSSAKDLRVNSVKGLMYLKRRDSSLRSE